MLPKFYQNCLESQLNPRQYRSIQILLYLLQNHKTVQIEKLSALFGLPIKYESRRRHIQRLLHLAQMSVKSLWFPLFKKILKQHYQKKKTCYVVIDRTQWRDRNIFMVSVVYKKRSLPIYWRILPKKGSSNFREQKALIKPILPLMKGYSFVVVGDREFGNIRLASWLDDKGIDYVLRTKSNKYIRGEGQDYQRINTIELAPGQSWYLAPVQLTKQKGFGKVALAGYRSKSKQLKQDEEGWYLLTNLGTTSAAIKAYKCRYGIEAMFKDCKTGGYNLEKCHANVKRLDSLILLITLAYSCAVLRGQKLKKMGIQSYISRLNELNRNTNRHSNFWVGLYGQAWICGMEFCRELVQELMQLTPNKLPFYQQGMRAMSLILSTL
jgi:hypothetical protein